MRINDGFLSGARIGRSHDVDSSPAPAARPESAAFESASSYSSASELAQLLAAAGEVEEVRSELVSDVKRRLAAGEYGTRDAAERTAQALLGPAD